MGNQIFTGVGCFAKPEKLGRIFSKLVQNYTLGPFKGDGLRDGNLADGREGVDLLQALATGQARGNGSGDSEIPGFKRPRKITGFYLAFIDQKLNLSIFARGSSSRSEIITTSLDELTRLRQKRLN